MKRTDLAIEFLRKLREDGPWILTAILPDEGKIATQTFYADQIIVMNSWIERFQGTRNLYFTLNSVAGEVIKKPEKTQISQIIAFHCDVDLRVGEDHTEGRNRILNFLKDFKPKPSIIIDSGNGYQPIWLLKDPITLDGTLEKAEEYEAYNKQLEILLEGDHCFNIDRILRLPGTINVPDKKKAAKGRVPILASCIEWNDLKYGLSDFTAAPLKIQAKNGKESLPGGGEKIQLSGNIQNLHPDQLETKGVMIHDSIKDLIVNGDVRNKYSSRSEALFAVVCALIKSGVSDDDVAGIIMNRENKISESVLDKPRAERYAAKQIQNAKEEIESPQLRKMNAKHAVIHDIAGKCRIISEVYDYALRRPRISYQSFPDFQYRYCNSKIQIAEDKKGEAVYKPLGLWWIGHPLRREYETVVFAPGKEVSEAYNLWQGFACEAIPGECELFLDHIRLNICQGNEEYYNYIMSWMARCVQQPDCPGEVAIVLRGEMGTGKGVFARHFGSLFGRHYIQVSDPKHLVGSFNSHLRDCIVLFGDEAFYAGDKKHESVLKSLVTEPTLAIEQKGVDVFASPNYTHIILASNSNWVIPAGSNERRFFALDVSVERMQDKIYFAMIRKQMDNGGKEALLHCLLARDITNFEVREVPKTSALQDQKLLSYSSEESWWYEKLEEGRVLKSQDNWEREVMKHELQEDYISFMQKTGILRKATPVVLGKFLGRVCPGGRPRSYQKMAKVAMLDEVGQTYYVYRRVYFYELPELEVLRSHWDKFHGGPFKWDPIQPKPEQPELGLRENSEAFS